MMIVKFCTKVPVLPGVREKLPVVDLQLIFMVPYCLTTRYFLTVRVFLLR